MMLPLALMHCGGTVGVGVGVPPGVGVGVPPGVGVGVGAGVVSLWTKTLRVSVSVEFVLYNKKSSGTV